MTTLKELQAEIDFIKTTLTGDRIERKDLEKKVRVLEDGLNILINKKHQMDEYDKSDRMYEKVQSWPKSGDDFFSIIGGEVVSGFFVGKNPQASENDFKTRQEAEHELTRRKVAARYRNGEWKVKDGESFAVWYDGVWDEDHMARMSVCEINLGLVAHPNDTETQDFIRRAVESGAYDI
jgi:hypothetical protein